jgi:hypothetical protein
MTRKYHTSGWYKHNGGLLPSYSSFSIPEYSAKHLTTALGNSVALRELKCRNKKMSYLGGEDISIRSK